MTVALQMLASHFSRGGLPVENVMSVSESERGKFHAKVRLGDSVEEYSISRGSMVRVAAPNDPHALYNPPNREWVMSELQHAAWSSKA